MTAPRLASSTMGRAADFCRGSLSPFGRPSEKIAAMELDGEVRILELMAGEDQNDRFAGFDEPAKTQLLEPRQRDGRGRFAPDAIGANFGFGNGDLDFRNLFDLTAGRLQHAQRFLPRCRIADAYGGRQRVGSHRFELLAAELAYASGRTDSRPAPE